MRRSDLSNKKGATLLLFTLPLYRLGFTNIVNQFIISKAIEPFLPDLVLSQIAIPAPTALVNMNIIVNPFITITVFLSTSSRTEFRYKSKKQQ